MAAAMAIAVAATMSCAFAEEPAAVYTAETNRASVTGAWDANGAVEAGDQVTVAVIAKDADPTDGANYYYINQDEFKAEGFSMLTDMGLKGSELAEGTYLVKIGYTDCTAPYVYEFTVGGAPKIVYGDVDGVAGVTATDAATVLKHASEVSLLDEALRPAADVDGVAGITATDAATILKYASEVINEWPVEAK